MVYDAKTTRWWWIRHAPVPSSGRIYGASDVDADVSNTPLFQALARILPRDAYWVTSHLRRTHQTASSIRRHLLQESSEVADPAIEPLLGEQDFGEFQGRERAAFMKERRDAERWHRFWLTGADECPPGGESFRDLYERVAYAIEKISEEQQGGDVIAVAHGGTIRAAIAHALELDLERALTFSIDNCALTRIDKIFGPPSGQARDIPVSWRLERVNFLPPANPSEDL